MEPPNSFEANALRDEKLKVLKAVRPVLPHDTVRAQYAGYAQTDGVAPHSQTPTYAALKLIIDNWRWQGVPFYLRSGKALARKQSEIIIEFKKPPHLLFKIPENDGLMPNLLSMRIQPDEGIHLTVQAKEPDSLQQMRAVEMRFHYKDEFRTIPDGYERLLLDAINGDAALFTRADEIEAAWGIIDPVIHEWEHGPDAPPLDAYPVGTWGPASADVMLARSGRVWRVGDLAT
jgi:glucose-6-phosphate 1-dehydrogenase